MATTSLKSKGRARLTNGVGLLTQVDGRSAFARRFRDLNIALVGDLGVSDPSQLSEGQRQLVRRASALSVELERLESRFAQQGGAEPAQLEVFQRSTNTLRRTVESLGLHTGRIARDTTLDLQSYLELKRKEKQRAEQGDTIDAEVIEDEEGE